MKIVFVCNEYPPRPHGGLGTFVQTVARGLYGRGHEVTVVGLGEADNDCTSEGINIVTLGRNKLRYVGNLLSRIRLRRWVASRVKDGRVDVVEAPDYEGMLPLGIPNCAVVIRLNLSATSIWQQAGRKIPKGISFYERRTLVANPNWIAASHYVFELTKAVFGISPIRSEMIYNPVPPIPSCLPDKPDLPGDFVLYAGSLSKRKGAIVLAEAAREFLSSHPDLHLVYVGGGITMASGGGRRPIEEQIREAVGPKLTERVHFLGHVNRENVLACMVRAKVFAFPSSLEALGIVVLEAMSCGLPVVCTKYPPGPEMVEDGVNGLLADPGSPRDLSEKITRLLDDPVLAAQLAANARRIVAERFSLEKCITATERFYEECLKG
jgi:glycosyltransferase involved in cell wall biosynthesis